MLVCYFHTLFGTVPYRPPPVATQRGTSLFVHHTIIKLTDNMAIFINTSLSSCSINPTHVVITSLHPKLSALLHTTPPPMTMTMTMIMIMIMTKAHEHPS